VVVKKMEKKKKKQICLLLIYLLLMNVTVLGYVLLINSLVCQEHLIHLKKLPWDNPIMAQVLRLKKKLKILKLKRKKKHLKQNPKQFKQLAL
jgi:hypothetical protein